MTPDEVPGLIPETTGNLLRDLAREVPANRVIVELGAYKGRSTCYLGYGSSLGHGAQVVSVDPWEMGTFAGPKGRDVHFTDADNRAEQARHLKACGVDHLVTVVHGLSQQVPLPQQPIGLLWVDGDHEYEAVKADITRWTPLVATGGHVVFDDYKLHCRGVDKAVREFARSTAGKRWEWDTSLKPLAVGRRR